MLIALEPFTDANQVAETLRKIQNDITAIHRQGRFTEQVNGYLRWAHDAAIVLRNRLPKSEIDRLILTPNYEQLRVGLATDQAGLLLLSEELASRKDALEVAVLTLQAKLKSWAGIGHFVGFDTSFVCNYKKQFCQADYQTLLAIPNEAVRIILPVLVVDELDGLKEKAPDEGAKRRAREAIKTLWSALQKPGQPGQIQAGLAPINGGGLSRGGVSIEILFDPPGHKRQPIEDDEIVDRLASIAPITGTQITFLTFDIGQAFRAREAGLDARLLGDSDRRAPYLKPTAKPAIAKAQVT